MDNSLGISQNIAWPGLYKNNRKLLNQQTILAERTNGSLESEITRNVKNAWYSYLLNRETFRVLKLQDSVYSTFMKKAAARLKAGETSKLEMISATTKYQEVQALMTNAEAELKNSEYTLKQLLNMDGDLNVAKENLIASLSVTTAIDPSANPQAKVELQNIEVANARLAVEKSKSLPEFTLGYYQQLLISGFNPANISRTYSPGTRIAGIQFGIAVPIFNGANRSRINAENIGIQIAKSNLENTRSQVTLAYNRELEHFATFRKLVDYYQSSGLKLADEQSRIAQVSFNLGEIGYMEYIQHISGAIQTKLAYIEALSQLNQSVIQLQYLKGN